MRIRIATSQRLLCIAFLIILLFSIGFFTGPINYSAQAAAQPAAGADRLSVLPLLLKPVASTSVELQTHTVDATILDLDDGTLRLQTVAHYTLHNPTEDAETLFVRVVPASSLNAAHTAPHAEISLEVDGAPVGLEPNGGSEYSAQLSVPADAQRLLRLQYTQDLGATPLLTMRYPADELRVWSGITSMRFTLSRPESIADESLLLMLPDSWNYALSDNVRQPHVQWLYESNFPKQPFTIQLVHPAYWQQITAARLAAATGSLSGSARLGELYQNLYFAAVASAQGDEETAASQPLYAQAVAAFAAGIERADTATDATAVAALHAGLARLYRSQITRDIGIANATYAQLLIQEVEAALAAGGASQPQYDELVQWLHEGLYTLYLDAQSRANPIATAQLLERMAAATETYGRGILTEEQLAEAQRVATMQQAIQLLEQENRTAAMALAGSALNDVDLAPPSDAQSLFASWQITLTLVSAGESVLVGLEADAQPQPDHWVEAREDMGQIAQSWQERGVDTDFASTLAQDAEGSNSSTIAGRLSLSFTGIEPETVVALAETLPPHADWELLRLLFGQVQPTTTGHLEGIQQWVVMEQPLDLRTVGDQWSALAASLERQAAQFRAAQSTSDGLPTEEALRAQIQAAAYQDAARAWRNLARDSWVAVRMVADASTAERTWMATVTTPAQNLQLQAQQFSPVRLLVAGMALLSGLFLLAGLLWWLL